jgi:hypothetical protein
MPIDITRMDTGGGHPMRRLFALVLVAVALLLVAFLLLGRPAMAEATRCTTYEEKTLGRLQTVCTDGTRAVSTWHRTLERWESTVTPLPGQTCAGQLNPKTRQWEGRCR